MSIDEQPSETNGKGINHLRSSDEEEVSTALPRVTYGIREMATMLGVCEKTVRRLINRRLLRPSRALRHLLISKKEIDRFLRETSFQ